jgi:accessory gene regulator B
MTEKLSNYILDNFLYKGEQIEGDNREIMLFGITRILEDLPKYAAIFAIALVFKLFEPILIVLGVTVLYKTFIGGAHARTNSQCFVFSLMFFYTPVIISKYLVNVQNISYLLQIFTFIVSIYVILKIVPADTEEIPILNKNKRKKMKISAFIMLSIIYVISIFFIKDIYTKNIIILTMLIIDTFTMKFMYKFLKCKYSYESDEFKEYFLK